MSLNPATAEFLAALDAFSSGRLTRRDDLGFLLETAGRAGMMRELDDLSFQAKFAHRTYGIMQRIGKDGQGYAGLVREFTGALERCGMLAGSILESAAPAERDRFSRRYLALTPGAMQEFLALCYDLSWYKNWHIDRKAARSSPGPDSMPK